MGPDTPVNGDYFAFLGLPRKLNIDAADLEQRFRALSRRFHPDYFYNAPPAERRASLERASYLNDAFRTLRDAASRVEYLLQVEGVVARGAARSSGEVPASLLEEVFTLNEELDAVRQMKANGADENDWKRRLEAARQPIEAKRSEHERELDALRREWDLLVDRDAAADERRRVLDALRNRMLERNYINNLLAGIEGELTS